MMAIRAVIVALALSTSQWAIADEFKLPKEVTPSLRAACEKDVRRLCIGKKPTVAKVKACVYSKFFKLGRRCQIELAAAGLVR